MFKVKKENDKILNNFDNIDNDARTDFLKNSIVGLTDGQILQKREQEMKELERIVEEKRIKRSIV